MALAAQLTKNCLRRLLSPKTVSAEFALITQNNYCTRIKEELTGPLLKCFTKKSHVGGSNVAYVGGYGGIGFATCIELICKGIKKLCILDIRDDCPKFKYLKSINPELDLKFIRMNIASGEDEINGAIKKAHNHMGCINMLINGAGIIDDRRPELTLDVNLLGLIRTTMAAIPLMSKDNGGDGGLIVHVSSVLGLVPCPCIAIYTASKWGIIGFARSLSHEHYFDITGINHLTICPGPTDTPNARSVVTFDTFDYSEPLSTKLATVRKQLPIDCAIGMLKAIESGKNGEVWTIVLGEASPIKMTEYFEFKYNK